MKAYYLVVALAASLAAIAMATQLQHEELAKERQVEVDPEMEAWFI